jgi:hypothetical protein
VRRARNGPLPRRGFCEIVGPADEG